MAEQATEAPTPSEGEDQLQSTQAPSPETSAAPETTEPEYFSDNFDPSTLDEALQPAYKQLRGDYTRKTQELAEQRKQAESVQAAFTDLQSDDPETSQEALKWLTQVGLLNENVLQKVLPAFDYEFDDQGNAEEEPAPYVTREEWEAQQQAEQLKAQEAQQEAWVAQYDNTLMEGVDAINAQRKQEGRSELSQKAQRQIVKSAMVDAPPGQLPDVAAAYEEYVANLDDEFKVWASTKHGGATRGGGVAATGVPDLDNMTGEQRRAWQAQRLRELNEDAGP